VQPERVRQKKLERKRRKREQKRQTLQLRSTRLTAGSEVIVPFPKMSDTLVEFARPLIDRLPADPPAEELKLVLTFASFVWNCVLKGANAHELVLPNAQTVLDILGLSPAEAGAVVDGLIRRKKEMFVDDERLVVSVHAFRERGMLRILAASAW
jgi:hypothetical protein